MTSTKKIVFFYYDGFVEFEIALAFLYLQDQSIQTVALELREYKSLEGQRFFPDEILDHIHPADIDLLVIPGGDPELLLSNPQLRQFIVDSVEAGVTIAGICGGADLMVAWGLLKGKRCTGNAFDPAIPEALKECYQQTLFSLDHVVTDGNFITAQGSAFAEFATILANRFGNSNPHLPGFSTEWLLPIEGWTEVGSCVKVSTSSFEECNLTLIVSGSEALLVDTGYRKLETDRVIEYIRHHQLCLKAIIITHHHADHDPNVSRFRTGNQPVYDVGTIGDGFTIHLGAKTVRLFPTPGHHPIGDISVLIEEDQILIAGDILFSCLPPMLGYGARPDILIKTIETIANAHYQWIVPGHGRVMTGDSMTSMALSYISFLKERLMVVIRQNGTIDDLCQIKLSDCIAHSDWMIEEPSIDLHRQNKEELFLRMMKETTNHQ